MTSQVKREGVWGERSELTGSGRAGHAAAEGPRTVGECGTNLCSKPGKLAARQAVCLREDLLDSILDLARLENDLVGRGSGSCSWSWRRHGESRKTLRRRGGRFLAMPRFGQMALEGLFLGERCVADRARETLGRRRHQGGVFSGSGGRLLAMPGLCQMALEGGLGIERRMADGTRE